MGDVTVFDNSLEWNVRGWRIVAVPQSWMHLLYLLWHVVTTPNRDFNSASSINVTGNLICIHIYVVVWNCRYVPRFLRPGVCGKYPSPAAQM